MSQSPTPGRPVRPQLEQTNSYRSGTSSAGSSAANAGVEGTISVAVVRLDSLHMPEHCAGSVTPWVAVPWTAQNLRST